jgi:hypothetical protein
VVPIEWPQAAQRGQRGPESHTTAGVPVKFAVQPTIPILLGAVVAVLAFAPSAFAAGTVTVGIQGQGSATGTGINCTQSGGPDCSESYADDEEQICDPELKPPCHTVSTPPFVTFTAGANQNGFQFDHWTGCDSTSGTGGRTCELTVVADTALTATFVDGQAPSVSSPSPGSGLQRGNITLGATASDNAGVTGVEFRVRGSVIGTDTSAPYSMQFDTSTVADGSATIRATAADARGNVGIAESTITIDNTAPTLGVTGPNGQTFGPGSTQSWTISSSDTNGVGSTQCSLVPTGAPPSFGACSGGSAGHSVTGKPEGGYTLVVRATDNAGNVTTQSRTFAVDATPPDTTITGGPANGSSSTSPSASFTFSASEPGSTFACRVSPSGVTPGAFSPCSGSGAHTAAGLAPGNYIFEVVATDQYGNADGSPASRSFTVTAAGTENAGPGGGNPGEVVTDAQIATKLGIDLAAAARKLSAQRRTKLARKGSIGLVFNALLAGRFTLAFKGAATKGHAARSVTIAKGSSAVTAAGGYTVKLKLTKAGKRLLRSGRTVKGKLTAKFTKAGGGSVAGSRGATLKRR